MVVIVIVVVIMVMIVVVATARMGIADRTSRPLLDGSGPPQPPDQDHGRDKGDDDAHGSRNGSEIWHLVVPG